jgi:hypothetical protein
MRLLSTLAASVLLATTAFADDQPEQQQQPLKPHHLMMHGGCSDYHNYETGYRQPLLKRIRGGIAPACEWLQGAIDAKASHYHDMFDVPVGMADDEDYDPEDRPVATVRCKCTPVFGYRASWVARRSSEGKGGGRCSRWAGVSWMPRVMPPHPAMRIPAPN